MAKMIDFQTVTRGILPSNAAQIQQELKSRYIENGWELFNTHFMKQVDEEVHMIYVFVKYEPVELVVVDRPSETDWNNTYGNVDDSGATEAPRRRGRPRKVEVTGA